MNATNKTQEATMQMDLGNGTWVEIEATRAESFLASAEHMTQRASTGPAPRPFVKMSRVELVAALESGHELRTGTEWYDRIRATPKPRAATPAPEMKMCDCGHMAAIGSVMSSSRGTSCPDCYDRMSE